MMWVIRAGQNDLYYDKFIHNSKVYITWDGYKVDLSGIKMRADFRTIVEKEKGIDNRTSVSNWAGQLYAFAHEIEIGDYVLIPSKVSHTYCFARIIGNYFFDKNEKDKLYHCRTVEIIETDIPKDLFSQQVIYSLGAYRTIFKAKHEDDIITTINKWKEEKR